ncbi:hypothetical protein A1F97_01557 [Pyrenophora tritici-repentis]|nr:hypothetical protein PtrSN001C_002832 [Pyrenophora tritici-repentis]KAI1550902.1 hypothetical protein PtrSN001A_000122 [Pyrenophora tritici-repentis]KAI1579195.1 hypothetical protein PtrEW4_000641 [Pyrenophora tritici-repentis]KAI1602112.1 hypothetical protein PtrEW13061_000134 [Pyrenophora tritici-repentis]KAI1607421.1 hypothetical protein PtrCC142_000366 [Pyrenophora tritici-repentis]
MAFAEHWIYPNADTVIILKSPQPDDEFAPWSYGDGIAANSTAMVNEDAVATTLEDIPIDAVPDIPEGSVLYYVSSRQLILASPLFESMLQQDAYREGHKKTDGYYYVITEEWNAEAFLLLMNMLHLQCGYILLSPSFETMDKLAVIVDYYDCAKAIEIFTSLHMKRMVQKKKFKEYNRKLILEILVSFVFKWRKCFEAATRSAILECDENTVRMLGLPIPLSVTTN